MTDNVVQFPTGAPSKDPPSQGEYTEEAPLSPKEWLHLSALPYLDDADMDEFWEDFQEALSGGMDVKDLPEGFVHSLVFDGDGGKAVIIQIGETV